MEYVSPKRLRSSKKELQSPEKKSPLKSPLNKRKKRIGPKTPPESPEPETPVVKERKVEKKTVGKETKKRKKSEKE